MNANYTIHSLTVLTPVVPKMMWKPVASTLVGKLQASNPCPDAEVAEVLGLSPVTADADFKFYRKPRYCGISFRAEEGGSLCLREDSSKNTFGSETLLHAVEGLGESEKSIFRMGHGTTWNYIEKCTESKDLLLYFDKVRYRDTSTIDTEKIQMNMTILHASSRKRRFDMTEKHCGHSYQLHRSEVSVYNKLTRDDLAINKHADLRLSGYDHSSKSYEEPEIYRVIVTDFDGDSSNFTQLLDATLGWIFATTTESPQTTTFSEPATTHLNSGVQSFTVKGDDWCRWHLLFLAGLGLYLTRAGKTHC
ncbi:hypothetical protein ElyMa_006922600 [Elysia marginata]|uniref:Uncharacterized protein n=1 Tax=Elysia marginata TaxID=1093978 RepID=A0AAV4JEW6_9GAST|nr:hypothetical protein ElyMa_006922600 [Elysia marginata]